MSNQKDSGSFALQVAAGALAAVTAAVLGSTLGVAGTVLGAGIASVVTTVGAALYLRSIRRTTEAVRLVQDKVRGRWTGTLPAQDPAPAGEPPKTEEPGDEPEAEDNPPERAGRRRWPAVAAASVVAFALGMLALTGLELIRGEQVDGGQGTTIGRIVRSDQGPADRQDPAPTGPTTPTEAPGMSTGTVPPPTTTQRPEPSRPTTTTVPSPTTTTRTPSPLPSGVG
ncbi:MAG TPA: hypothetical protein VGX25_15185 [Actinophytocola sp.]|uniref:hypothetical protein n=1 Tax=Actinophytocola sp. TaxID=1872138 RepID=UPI002DDDAD69|nr:hypothetical protein [Actinophytocola sp.]HEV2780732.1 hypothetical protein [Actinophytocola sp.]